jgi:hypothetical protein
MGTQVSKSAAALPAAVAALANIGQNAVATTGAIGTGDAFGRFTKDGLWVYGQEEIEIQEGSTWAVNPMSLRHGHIGWPEDGGGRPTEVTVPLTDPLPAQPEDSTLRWSHCMSFTALCLTGDDEGQQVLLKGGSLGFLKATTGIAQQISGRAIEGEAELVPQIEFEGSSYQHKKYGKINTPVLKVVSWATMEGITAAAEESEPEPEVKPEPKAEAKKPARRRRVQK